MCILFEDGYYFLHPRQLGRFLLLDSSHYWIAKNYFFYSINFLAKFTVNQSWRKTVSLMPLSQIILETEFSTEDIWSHRHLLGRVKLSSVNLDNDEI